MWYLIFQLNNNNRNTKYSSWCKWDCSVGGMESIYYTQICSMIKVSHLLIIHVICTFYDIIDDMHICIKLTDDLN